jgi:predicted nucleotidyltransferase
MNSFRRRCRSCVRDCCRFVKSIRLPSLKSSVRLQTEPQNQAVTSDLMVTFRPGVKVGTEFLDMISELEDLLGCSVDLLESESVATMENWIKRKSILSCTKTIYAVEV